MQPHSKETNIILPWGDLCDCYPIAECSACPIAVLEICRSLSLSLGCVMYVIVLLGEVILIQLWGLKRNVMRHRSLLNWNIVRHWMPNLPTSLSPGFRCQWCTRPRNHPNWAAPTRMWRRRLKLWFSNPPQQTRNPPSLRCYTRPSGPIFSWASCLRPFMTLWCLQDRKF